MNILGKEQPIIYQIDDVFDPRMANMVYNAQQNYINALREDYLQTDKDLKDFRKEYGDFYSPFSKDNENWDRLTNGAIREVMDKYGPDMLRSIEGRAEIQKALNSIPYGELQKLRASVQPAMQFLKNNTPKIWYSILSSCRPPDRRHKITRSLQPIAKLSTSYPQAHPCQPSIIPILCIKYTKNYCIIKMGVLL